MCLDSTVVAEIDGFEGGGGSVTIGDDDADLGCFRRCSSDRNVCGCVVVYGEAVVEVWGRSENIRVFPATPAATRWSVVVPGERERY